jgi:hypothetical protein
VRYAVGDLVRITNNDDSYHYLEVGGLAKVICVTDPALDHDELVVIGSPGEFEEGDDRTIQQYVYLHHIEPASELDEKYVGVPVVLDEEALDALPQGSVVSRKGNKGSTMTRQPDGSFARINVFSGTPYDGTHYLLSYLEAGQPVFVHYLP